MTECSFLGLPERTIRQSSVRSSIRTKPGDQIFHQVSSKPYSPTVSPEKSVKPEQILGFPIHRGYHERSSTRYPSTQKLVLNGAIAVSEKVNGLSEQYRPEPLRSGLSREEHTHKVSGRSDQYRHREENQKHPPQRASIAESQIKENPPPLHPRQMRINQSMRARVSHDRHVVPIRSSPEKDSRSA